MSRREIEAAWAEQQEPLRRRLDEIAALRATVAQQARRIEALERAMRKRLPTEPLIDGIAQGFGQALKAERQEIGKKLDALDPRIGALEQRPVYTWKGPFVEGTEHEPGHLVQRSGNVWLCTATTKGTPGKCEDFALFVRSCRDGRDLVRKERTLR
jgi:hypothetical protein